ncbi:flagellar basal body-associated FliL family protein [Pengzhenrongella sp.]|jgi:flagellar FliL protein|uniref:flagellar basal body-associated FliL family protein n=1 Tax=Pengzhenrongella sp. TaxID=2888820 RepID=UPI002F91C96A
MTTDMVNEQRVISSSPKPVGGGIREGRAKLAAVSEAPEEKKRKKPGKLVLIIAAVVVLALAGAAYFFLLKPSGGETKGPPPPPAPVPGTVLTIDPVSVNLANGHYLRLGLALQLTKEVKEAPDSARALDHAITVFSGHTVQEVTDPKTREQLKEKLVKELDKAYDGEVMDVYLTDYVTQ